MDRLFKIIVVIGISVLVFEGALFLYTQRQVAKRPLVTPYGLFDPESKVLKLTTYYSIVEDQCQWLLNPIGGKCFSPGYYDEKYGSLGKEKSDECIKKQETRILEVFGSFEKYRKDEKDWVAQCLRRNLLQEFTSDVSLLYENPPK